MNPTDALRLRVLARYDQPWYTASMWTCRFDCHRKPREARR